MKKEREAITEEQSKKKEKRFSEIRNIIEWLEDKVGKISHKVKKKKQDRKIIRSFYTVIRIIGAPERVNTENKNVIRGIIK